MQETEIQTINKVCVIGAGTMGAGIAAQIANAGLDVLLLDIAGSAGDRNGVVQKSLERIAKSEPPFLIEPDKIKHIAIGNIEDDLPEISGCDWVVEAIVERLEIKRELYRNMLAYLKPGAMVSSNTSTIPISLLMENMPDQLRRRFCITHFFNPVRYMRLLELVAGKETEPEVMNTLADFSDRALGKGVVECADTPGFLGNRVGVFAMQAAIHEATELGIDIEDADALFGRPMGIPKTGVFALYDLIGLDLMADVVRSLRSILPQEDAFHEVGAENDLINSQVAKGFKGNKGKGGFYCVQAGKKFALDLSTGEWRTRKKEIPELARAGEEGGLSKLVQGDDLMNLFCWRVLARILAYSANLIPTVTQSPQDIDDAMKLGYNWVRGPFEMLDELGLDWFIDRLKREGWPVPEFLDQSYGNAIYRVTNNQLQVRNWDGGYKNINLRDDVVRFHLMRRTLKPILQNDSASLFHLEGGVRLVEFHSKANALDALSMSIVSAAANDPGPGILVHNDGQHFSAGVNLARFLEFIKAQDWQGMDDFLKSFQQAVAGLLYCDAPVIGAPSGLAIGGGFEVLAHCDKVVAHTNSVLGLVEATVGLVPGGGGVKETYLRWYQKTGNWERAAWKTFNQIGYGQTGSSPVLSAKMCYFKPGHDETVINRDRLVPAALEALSKMRTRYNPRPAPKFKLAGREVYLAMLEYLEAGKEKGVFYPHDVRVASAIAAIVTGGESPGVTGGESPGVTGGESPGDIEVSEQTMFDFERENFIDLAKTQETQERIEAMLAGRGAIRN